MGALVTILPSATELHTLAGSLQATVIDSPSSLLPFSPVKLCRLKEIEFLVGEAGARVHPREG